MFTITAAAVLAAALSTLLLAVLLRRTRRQLAAAAHEAATDPLTGLANRRCFTTHLEAAIGAGGPVAVALLDVDALKFVNDHHGHQAGDHVLATVADQLAGLPAPVVLAARLSGDEFALLIAARASHARTVAWSAWQAIAARPVTVAGRQLAVRASVGLASWRPGVTGRALLHHADEAMYEAKATNARVCVHTQHMPDQPLAARPAYRQRDLPKPRPVGTPPSRHT